MAELADALDLGSSVSDMQVRPLSPAPKKSYHKDTAFFIQVADLAYHRRKAYIISPWAVYHHDSACMSLRLDEIQHYVLMICNSRGIDDIQHQAVDF